MSPLICHLWGDLYPVLRNTELRAYSKRGCINKITLEGGKLHPAFALQGIRASCLLQLEYSRIFQATTAKSVAGVASQRTQARGGINELW